MLLSEMSTLQVVGLLLFLFLLLVGADYVLFHNWMKSHMVNKVASVVINAGMIAVIIKVAMAL